MSNNRIALLTIIFLGLLFSGCHELERIMMVSTGSPESVSSCSAIIGGQIIDTGEDATSFGHCYSKTPGAGINSLKTEMGPFAGKYYFKSSLYDLEPATKYFVRAYIRKDHSLTYGKEISFTTLPLDPVYKRSVIENATPDRVEIEFDLQLAAVLPSPASFVVTVNSRMRTIRQVSVNNNKIFLTLDSAAVGGDEIKMAYIKPVGSPVQAVSGGKAGSVNLTDVINKVDPLPPVPLLEGAAVENETPGLVELTYSLTLANIVPDVSAFTVTINSSPGNISQVSVKENKILLNLTTAILFGDIVYVTYTKPLVDPVQTPSGGRTESFSDHIVTNNVGPVCSGSVVEEAAPSLLKISFTSVLADILPETSAFSLLVNSASRSILSITITGSEVILTLSEQVIFGDILTISYTRPATNPLQSESGKMAGTFTGLPVTNMVKPAIPVYISSSVEEYSPTLIEMTYDQILANIAPSASAFTVSVNTLTRTVSSVAVAENKVRLILSKSVRAGDVITLSYSKPTVNPLQTPAGGQAESLTEASVTNNVLK